MPDVYVTAARYSRSSGTSCCGLCVASVWLAGFRAEIWYADHGFTTVLGHVGTHTENLSSGPRCSGQLRGLSRRFALTGAHGVRSEAYSRKRLYVSLGC